MINLAKLTAVATLAISSFVVAQAQTVKSAIALPNLPEQVAVSPLTNTVYVAVPNFGDLPYDYVTVINGKTNAIVKNIEIPPIAYAIAVNDITGLVYVGGYYVDANGITQNEVVTVNPFKGAVVSTLSISNTEGSGILGLAVNSLTGTVYAANASDNELDVICHGAVHTKIALSGAPFGVSVNPLSNRVYVTLQTGDLVVIDGKTNTILSTLPYGITATQVATNIATGNVFVTNSVGEPYPGSVGVFDKNNNQIASIPLNSSPFGIDVDPVTNLAFTADIQNGTVSIIDGSTNTVKSTLPVSGLFLAVNPVTHLVYVATFDNSSTLVVISEK